MSVEGLMDYVSTNTTLLVPLLEAEDPETCRLLGPFALVVQAIMGALVLGSLAIKRAREKPRRKWKVWICDVAKQVIGQMVLHAMNVLVASAIAAHKGDNPCAGYALNIIVDTTFGVGVLYGCLKLSTLLLHHFDPSYRTGFYGEPFSFGMWARQCGVYVLAVIAMKLVVVVVFWMFPWMFTVANWSLAWLDSDEAQLLIVMLVLPTCMNMFQFLLLDTILRFKSPDAASEADSSERAYLRNDYSDDDDDEEAAIGRRAANSSSGSDPKISARLIEDGKKVAAVTSRVNVASSNSSGIGGGSSPAGLRTSPAAVDGFSYPPTASSSLKTVSAPGLRSRANSTSSSAPPSRIASPAPVATHTVSEPAPAPTPPALQTRDSTDDTSAWGIGSEPEEENEADVDDGADWGFDDDEAGAVELASEKVLTSDAAAPRLAQLA